MSESPAIVCSADDTATVVGVGALAATLAAISHETLGHGLGCLEAGGHITLLTSVWFRCAGGSAIADAGGPVGNLVAGAAALALLSYTRAGSRARLLMLMFSALNLFWFTAQLAVDSLTNSSDWHYAALQMGWSPLWRMIGVALGVGGYVLVRRWVCAVIRRQGGPRPQAIRLAYAAAAASAVIAGLMWRPEPFRSALEGFLVLGIAPLGLLSVARSVNHDGSHEVGASCVHRSWVWIWVCVALFSLFLLIQARGLGPMATSSLMP